jgi:hypothetical protein
MFMEQTTLSGSPLFVYVFENGRVCLIFQDKQYLFEKPFGEHLSGTFQLFVQDNIVVLFSGLMFVSFIFERNIFSKIEYKSYQECLYKRFVKRNVILLSIESIFLSFTLENGRFTMRNYPNRLHFCGGILIFVKGTPYFVCCIHPCNSQLIVDAINLITGQKNTVLEMTKNDHFISFQINDDGSLLITTTLRGDYTTSVVDPLIIHDPRESWRQDEGFFWDRVRSC